jgi:hypothetical protein
MPARRFMASAGLSTPRLALPLKYERPRDIRGPITRLTERLQSMGGLRHRGANPFGSGGRASKEYRPTRRPSDVEPIRPQPVLDISPGNRRRYGKTRSRRYTGSLGRSYARIVVSSS